MPNDDHQVRIPHVPSTSYKVAPIDGAVVSVMKDSLGVTLALTMTRFDGLPSMEIIPGTLEAVPRSLSIHGEGQSTFEGSVKKVQEFTAILRPDRALEIAQVIINNLAQLSPEERERYRLPDFQISPRNEGEDTDDK